MYLQMTDQHPDCNIGFRYERVPSSGSLRRSQVKWRLAMDWGDTPKTVGPEDAEALMQLANAAAGAENQSTETAAAKPAACEPAVHQAAAEASTDAFPRGGTATAAPLTHAENADATDAVANACSALEVQLTEAAHDMQAVAAAFAVDTSSTQIPNATQEPSASGSRHCPVATPAYSSPQEPTESAAAVTNSGNQVGLSRGDKPCAQQSGIAAKNEHSLSAAAPKAARVQTIPNMLKKRKAQSMQLPHQLRMHKIPCVEVVDLVDEPLPPAASDMTSQGDFGCGHDNPDVIVVGDEADTAVDAGLADMSKGEVKAAAASPVLIVVKQPIKQPVDKQALILEMIQSLRCPRLLECFKQEQQKYEGRLLEYFDWIHRMYIGLQETLEDIQRLPLSEQENDVVSYFRVFFGLAPSV
ncbi:hypothetical protein ABBQ38_002324 [Trebouxia sp. C0009 RCD-2024]